MSDINTVMEPGFLETDSRSDKGAKFGWFLLGLGVGAGLTMLVLHRDSLYAPSQRVVERVQLRFNPNMV